MIDKNIVLYYQNCRGLRTKLNTIYMNILIECYDVIILTETWLSPNILDSEFIDSRYNVFRCDRNRDATGKKDGGGTLIAVHQSVITTRLTLKSVIPLNFDYVLLKLKSHNKNKYHIMCSVYITNYPP